MSLGVRTVAGGSPRGVVDVLKMYPPSGAFDANRTGEVRTLGEVLLAGEAFLSEEVAVWGGKVPLIACHKVSTKDVVGAV